MSTKVFISQPMSDKTDEEIIAVRQQAQQHIEKLLGYKVEVVDSFFLRMLQLMQRRYGT